MIQKTGLSNIGFKSVYGAGSRNSAGEIARCLIKGEKLPFGTTPDDKDQPIETAEEVGIVPSSGYGTYWVVTGKNLEEERQNEALMLVNAKNIKFLA